MLAKLPWFGLAIGHGWEWTPRHEWALAIICLAMVFMASLVASRLKRLIIAVGVIWLLWSSGVLVAARFS